MDSDKVASLFTYPIGKGMEINLNELAEKQFVDPDFNPLLNPADCEVWVDKIANDRDVDFTWGGYLEDRSWLWRGSYLDASRAVHLGVDINVTKTTANPIRCPVRFKVRDIFHDPDQNGGWGTRITIETDKGIVIFAHVAMMDFKFLSTNVWYPGGTDLCYLGAISGNGGWYRHLHLQGLKSIEQLDCLDGYGPAHPDNAEYYPNPLKILGLID